MKAFKGCTNPDCRAYKKIHYKKQDEFCLKCGNPLYFVCAGCWKRMEDGESKFCISCAAEKDQRHAENWDAVKKVGGGVVAAVGAVAVAIPTLVKESKKFFEDANEIIKAVKK